MRFFLFVPRLLYTFFDGFFIEGIYRQVTNSHYRTTDGMKIASFLLLVAIFGGYYFGVYELVETSREIRMGSETVEVPCVGLLDERDENFKYKSSTGNLVAGIMTADTIVGFPIYVLKGLWCPYKAKTTSLPAMDLSNVPTSSDED